MSIYDVVCDTEIIVCLSLFYFAFNQSTSDGVAKSYIDWIQYHGSEGPGVGEYDTDSSYKMQEARGGGKFNQSNSKSDLDWKIYNAQRSPGPGTYTSMPASSQIKGGKISVANVKSGE